MGRTNLTRNMMKEQRTLIVKVVMFLLVFLLVSVSVFALPKYLLRPDSNLFMDLVATGNFSGSNLTADYFSGDGSLLTGISSSAVNVTVGDGLILDGSNISFNTTYGDARYYPRATADSQFLEASQEGDLNVNHSDTSTLAEDSTAWITLTSLQAKWFADVANVFTFDEAEFNSSVTALLATTYFNASVGNVVMGTGAGTFANINTYDSTPYNVSEDGSSIDFVVNYTGITEFNQLIVRYKTIIGESHSMFVQIYDYVDSDWENYASLGSTEGEYNIITLGVFDNDKHINGGIVQVRFYIPPSLPAKTDKWSFDWVIISQGVATPSGAETDPFSIHKDGTIPLTANWDVGSYNITAQTFIGAIGNESNLNVNSSDYWDDLNTPADINAGDITADGTYLTVEADARWVANVSLVGFLAESEAVTGTWTMDSSTLCTAKNGLCNQSIADTNETARFNNLVGSCAVGNFINEVLANGTSVCDAPAGGGDITNVIAGTGLTGGGESGDVTLNLNSTFTGNFSDWNNASSWGDHALEGYLTAYTETDPLWVANLSLVGFLSEAEAVTGAWTYDGSLICTAKNGLCNQSVSSFTFSDYFDQTVNTTDDVTFNSITHNKSVALGDADTYIDFPNADQMELWAGGISFIHLIEGAGSGLVFNQDSNDIDFRVESDDYTYAFAVDGATGYVRMNNLTSCQVIETDADGILSCGTVTDTTYSHLSNFTDDIGVSDDWDAIGDVPVATPSDGDTTHLSTADGIYDWVIGLSYVADEADPLWVANISLFTPTSGLVGALGNWSADKSSYWDTSTDIDTVIGDDEITEGKISFGTTCAAGNHLYVSGNDLACEADDDTTYSAGNGLSLSTTTFSVAGNTALSQDVDGLSVTADGITDTQLAFNTGQHLTTTSNVKHNEANFTGDVNITGNKLYLGNGGCLYQNTTHWKLMGVCS